MSVAFSPITDQLGASRFTYGKQVEAILTLLPLPHEVDVEPVEMVKPKGVHLLVMQNRKCGDWYAEVNERVAFCHKDYREAMRGAFAMLAERANNA